MSAERILPDFLIIGAVKAATTWMTWQLQQSDGVYLPDPEPHYFTSQYGRGVDWYSRFFSTAQPGQLLGEKTADYLAQPPAPARVAALLPDVRLVVQLRDPVDRAYSDYCMLFRRGTVSGDIREYLDPGRATFRRFLDNGLYGAHLTRWFDHFPAEQLRVVLFEDVVARPAAILHEVADHIGLAHGLVPHQMSDPINDSRAQYLPLALRRIVAPLKQLAKPLRGERWFQRVRSTMARPVDYPQLPADLRARLRDYYASDLDALDRLIGRDLHAWAGIKSSAA